MPSETSSKANSNADSTEAPTGPEVQFGEYARAPRWLVAPPSSQRSGEVVTLEWKFDAGSQRLWKGLTREQLVEYAYKYLEKTFDDPLFRDDFRLAIRTGSYADDINRIEDPLPPLPAAPTTSYFGTKGGSPSILHDETFFYYTHKSPVVAFRPGMYAQKSPFTLSVDELTLS